MKKIVVAGVFALIAVSAAACGRMADLDAPPARQTERSQRDARAPGLPEPATINRPPSQMPIDGGPSSSPYGGSGSSPG
jgi:predicted small lipoprotein YifL